MFKPTYLYVKRHDVTGLLYFGKTSSKNPENYSGSGRYWSRHRRVHGNKVTTIWFELFDNKEDLVEFALFFSEVFDIVKSKEWANEKVENGLDGGCDFQKESSRIKSSITQSGRKRELEFSGFLSERNKGSSWWNDGVTNKFSKESPGINFKLGRIITKRNRNEN